MPNNDRLSLLRERFQARNPSRKQLDLKPKQRVKNYPLNLPPANTSLGTVHFAEPPKWVVQADPIVDVLKPKPKRRKRNHLSGIVKRYYSATYKEETKRGIVFLEGVPNKSAVRLTHRRS